MRPYRSIPILMILVILLTGCASEVQQSPIPTAALPQPGGQKTAAPTSLVNVPAVTAARQALASLLGLKSDDIHVVSSEVMDWPDICLGAPRKGEACALVVTKGYRVVLEANGQSYEYHTDQNGREVRLAPAAAENATPAASTARQVLAQQLHLNPTSIHIVSTAKVDWPDACLGISLPNVVCVATITPGYKVILGANGSTYEYHTDLAGSDVRLAAAPEPQIGTPAITWQSNPASGCYKAQISQLGVAFGACGGAMMSGLFATDAPERLEEYNNYTATYQSFKAETLAGSVTFVGAGSIPANAAVQRSIAEWAHLVTVEAMAGRSNMAGGLVLTWHREGGFAGFCDDLGVYVTGTYKVSSCKGGSSKILAQAYLAPDQLEKLYSWLDTFKSTQIENKDNAVADAMTVQLAFIGSGNQAMTAGDQRALLEFASALYNKSRK